MELGALQQDEEGRWTLAFERRFSNLPEYVWRVLTGPAHLSIWFPANVDLRVDPGSTLCYGAADVDGDGDRVIETGQMLESEPGRLLAFSWGDAVLRFELREEDQDVVLRFTYTTPELSAATGDAARWHVSLDLFAAEMDGEGQRDTVTERMAAIQPAYSARYR